MTRHPEFTAENQVVKLTSVDVHFTTETNKFLNPYSADLATGDLLTTDLDFVKVLDSSIEELKSLSADGILSGLGVTLATGLEVIVSAGAIWSRDHGTKDIAGSTITITPAEQDSEFLSTIVVDKSTGVISTKKFGKPTVDEILICDVKADPDPKFVNSTFPNSSVQAFYLNRRSQLTDALAKAESLLWIIGYWYDGVSFKKNKTNGFATDGGKLFYGARKVMDVPAAGTLPVTVYNHEGAEEVKTTFDANFLKQVWLPTDQAPRALAKDEQVFWYIYLLSNGTFAMIYPQKVGSDNNIDNRVLDANILAVEQSLLLPVGSDRFSTIIAVLVVNEDNNNFADTTLFQLRQSLSRGGGTAVIPDAPVVIPVPTATNASEDVLVDSAKHLSTEPGFENISKKPGIVAYFPDGGYANFSNQPKNTNIYTVVGKLETVFRDSRNQVRYKINIVEADTNIPNVSGTFNIGWSSPIDAIYQGELRAILIDGSKSFFDAIAANLPDFTSFKDQLDPEKMKYMIVLHFGDGMQIQVSTVDLTQPLSISDIDMVKARLKEIPSELKNATTSANFFPKFKYPLNAVVDGSGALDTIVFRMRDNAVEDYNDVFSQGKRDFYRIHVLSDEDIGSIAGNVEDLGNKKARGFYYPSYDYNFPVNAGNIFYISFIKLN
ncbi:hypothetical protein ASSaV_gp19 [Abalone shriveling syndrome-associated virus]|uniref:hypothetical protein n=1 Tax=Abalone shriveling syndrome-associated virus TaxID=491893 RepID=UPI0001881BB0|nr:hypothetical protein ASSaV_gp19 [Abalone shriveling syndrome-associated virus]ACJ71985.1 unknown [Abalone shriveling syndrome-associated virus]